MLTRTALLDELLAQWGPRIVRAVSEERAPSAGQEARVLSLGWPELEGVLPEGGLPRGCVVEVASPRALGGSTSLALSAVRAVHCRDERAWCAWVEADGSLYAPGVAMAGVDLGRLLVVRPPPQRLGRIAVKVAASRAFDVVVVEMGAFPQERQEGNVRALPASQAGEKGGRSRRARGWPSEVLVRKLALLAEEGGSTILLLTDSLSPRAVPWPVAQRLELSRLSPDFFSVRVAKERHGRIGLAKTVPVGSRPGLGSKSWSSCG